ncbi:MAG: immunoglobulin domain-containing protein [Verrucomicrobiae bacterium]|nr:immunoglobulin domain-containing protein [Verrucomicrobiae bacterium]
MKRLIICLCVWTLSQNLSPAASAPVANVISQSLNISESPTRVCVGNSGYYIADTANNALVAYNFYGQLLNRKTGLNSPLGVAASKTGKIYIGEASLKRVLVCDNNLNTIGFLGKGNDEFQLPNFIAVADLNGTETVFVSDSAANEIKIYQNNALANRFGSQGYNSGQFIFPSGIAINSQNELLVVDQGNDRVQVFSLNGVFKRAFSLARPGTFGNSGRPSGIACDSSDRIYVSDSLQCSIKVFDANGGYLSSIGKIGFGSGELYNPTAVAIDKYNRLFVASPNNYKIQITGVDCYLDMKISIPSQIIPSGTNVTLSVVSSCQYATYQWMKNATPLANNERISGATNSLLTINPTTPEDTGDYYLLLSNQNGSITSAPISLLVMSAPEIVKSPTNQTVSAGKTATFDVFATGGNLSYQWFFNGTTLAGASSSTLVLTNVSINNAGSYYAVVTNILGSATSQTAVLIVIDAPSLDFLRNQNGDLTFSWDTSRYTLQSTTNLTGVWGDVPATTSPLTITISQMQSKPSMYFRLKKKQ